MDTCVIPLRHGGLSLVQTTDYIYPIVDDPYMMVWISSFMGITFSPNMVLLIIHMEGCYNSFFICIIGSDIGLLYTPTLYVLNCQYFYFVGKNCLCQCSKWPVRHGSNRVWQHVDASGSQQQNVREGKRHVSWCDHLRILCLANNCERTSCVIGRTNQKPFTKVSENQNSKTCYSLVTNKNSVKKDIIIIIITLCRLFPLWISWVFTGERQSHATGHPGIQGCIGGGRHICNRRTDGAQPLGGDGRSCYNSLPAERIYHVGMSSYDIFPYAVCAAHFLCCNAKKTWWCHLWHFSGQTMQCQGTCWYWPSHLEHKWLLQYTSG